MKITEGKNYTELTIERMEDLFILYMVIEPGDLVYSWTVREVKGRGGERFGRERVYLGVRVKGLEFHEPRGSLRIRGIIEDYPEWLEGAGGSYHSIDVQVGSTIKVMRRINPELIGQLIDALGSGIRLLAVSMDMDETAIALMSRLGTTILSVMENRYMQDKEAGGSIISPRYIEEVRRAILGFVELHRPSGVILATREMLMNYLPDIELPGITVERVAVSEGGLPGIYEIERRGYLDKLGLRLGYDLVNSVMEELSRGSGLVAIGDEVARAVEMGAAREVAILDRFMIERADEARAIVNGCIRTRARIFIVPSSSEAGKILEGIGGIAALLRYRIG